jgi:hypothetical protein
MSVVSKKSKTRAKNNDLPTGAHDNDRFRHTFIPTLVWWTAYQPDAWKVDDNDLIYAMREIWQAVYGRSVPHKIRLNDSVFQVVRRVFI